MINPNSDYQGLISKVTSPLTSLDNVEFVKDFCVSDIINRWKQDFNIDISREFSKDSNKKIQLYRCLDSDLLFFEPRIAGSPYLYDELQKTFEWYYLKDKWEYKMALKEIKRQKGVVEIGCGKGTFIEKVIKETKVKIVGLETSVDAVKDAKTKGLPVFLSYINDYLHNNRTLKIDTVIAFQVLEHVPDPLDFISQLIGALQKGGRLIFSVPNQDCFYKYSDELLDMPPHHITRWSVKTFKFLESIFPVKLDKAFVEPLFYMHKSIWFRNVSNHYRNNKWFGKLIFNRFTNSIIQKALDTKLRNLIKGHTLYVSFTKK